MLRGRLKSRYGTVFGYFAVWALTMRTSFPAALILA